jgi:hypothetical protein
MSFAAFPHTSIAHNRFLIAIASQSTSRPTTLHACSILVSTGNDLRVPAERIRPIWHGFCGGREEIFRGNCRRI